MGKLFTDTLSICLSHYGKYFEAGAQFSSFQGQPTDKWAVRKLYKWKKTTSYTMLNSFSGPTNISNASYGREIHDAC